jgi:hypothetical protein
MTTKNTTPFPTSRNHGKPEGEPVPVARKPDEAELDEGIEESFPASDPVSVNVTKVVKKPGDADAGGRGKTEAGAAKGDDRRGKA